jgi:hypothetical protein
MPFASRLMASEKRIKPAGNSRHGKRPDRSRPFLSRFILDPGAAVSPVVIAFALPSELRSGDEAAWWQKLNIDPLPVALRLWQHTRLNSDGLAPSENITPSQAAQELDISVQDRAGTNDEARADVQSAVSKGVD